MGIQYDHTKTDQGTRLLKAIDIGMLGPGQDDKIDQLAKSMGIDDWKATLYYAPQPKELINKFLGVPQKSDAHLYGTKEQADTWNSVIGDPVLLVMQREFGDGINWDKVEYYLDTVIFQYLKDAGRPDDMKLEGQIRDDLVEIIADYWKKHLQ